MRLKLYLLCANLEVPSNLQPNSTLIVKLTPLAAKLIPWGCIPEVIKEVLSFSKLYGNGFDVQPKP